MDKESKKSSSGDKSGEGTPSSKLSSDKVSADSQKPKLGKKVDSAPKSAESKSQAKSKSAKVEKQSDSGDFTEKADLNKKTESKQAKKPSDEKASKEKVAEPSSDKTSSQPAKKKAAESSSKVVSSQKKTESKVAAEKSSDKNTSQEQATESSSKKASEKIEPSPAKKEEVKLSGLYAFKLAMSSLYDEKGQFVSVTLLEVKPWLVSQVKKKETDGYNSVQVACMPQKNNRCSKALKVHLSSAGFADGARYVREVRQDSVENIEVGQPVSIHSIQKGDKVKLQAISKGHGFAGVVKRWGFKGGPASHGAKTHRTSGSIGNRTEPARVMPGKKMAGHYGVEKISVRNVQVVDVVSDKNLIVVKGPVPGARNSLVFLSKRV